MWGVKLASAVYKMEMGTKNIFAEEIGSSSILEAIISTAAQGIVVLNKRRQYMFINPAAGKMTGENPDEWIGKEAGNFIEEGKEDIVLAHFIAAYKGEERSFETNISPPDGNVRELEVRLRPIDHNGERYILGVVSDLTLERKAQRERERILDGLSGCVMTLGFDGKVRYASKKTENVFGYTPEEVEGEEATMFVHPGDRAIILKSMAESLAKGNASMEVRFRSIHKSGRIINTVARGGLVKGEGFIGILYDETESQRTDELLRTQYKLSQDLAESSTLDEILELGLKASFTASGMMGGGMYLRNERIRLDPADTREGLVLGKSDGLSEGFVRDVSFIRYESDELEIVLKGNAVYDLENMSPAIRERLKSEGLKTIGVVPIKYKGEVIACMNVASYDVEKMPEYAKLALESIANQIGPAIVHKKAEELLKASEARNRAIIDSIPVGMHIYEFMPDGSLVFRDANNAADTTLGVDNLKLFCGKTIEEAFPTLIKKGIPEAYKKVAKTGKGWSTNQVDYDEQGINGAYMVRAFRITPLDEKGPILMAAAFLDITDQKKIEEQLRNSEARHSALLTNLSKNVGVATTDLEGRLILASQSLGDMHGVTDVTTFYGKEVMQLFFSPEEMERATDNLTKTIREGSAEEEYTLRRVDGTTYPAKIRATLIRDASGNPAGFSAIIEDVTQEKMYEQELIKMGKMDAVASVAGSIAHNFKNYLHVILAYSEFILKSQGIEDARVYATKIEDAVKRTNDIAMKLLALAKGGELSRDIESIEQLIASSAEFYQSSATSKIEYHIEKGVWNVDVDASKMSEVIQNLVINADHSMPHGEGLINIYAQNVVLGEGQIPPLAAGNYVKIIVQDTGSGISKENIDKVFLPYFTTKEDGTGLGLAFCYATINRHGGGVYIDSEEGNGTSVIMYLPATSKEKSLKPEIKEKTDLASGYKVLVVEDEKDIANLMRLMLEHAGHTCTVMPDGAGAAEEWMDAIQDGIPYDTGIFDATIKGGLGAEEIVVEILAKDPRAKLIISSGNPNYGSMVRFKEYGFSGRLEKPYSPTELLQKVTEVVGKR